MCEAQARSAGFANRRAGDAGLTRDCANRVSFFRLHAEEYSRGGFREEQRQDVVNAAQLRVFGQIDSRADSVAAVARETTLGQRHRQSPIAAIVRRTDETRLNRVKAGFLNGL